MCELGVSESLINPCTRQDTRLHTGLDPVVGYNEEYKYSVTL